MSSPLNGRIRALAREEATTLFGSPTPDRAAAGTDRIAELEREITELRATVKLLEKRIQAVENAPAQADQETRSARRTRGTSG